VVDRDGTELARSAPIGSSAQMASVSLRGHAGAIEIFAGTRAGYGRYRYKPGLIFEDAFEP
jgi:hypothetical protein